MFSFEIQGGSPLKGDVQISGAKNAVLPLMAAALLTPEKCVIRNVPKLSDIGFMAEILSSLGAKVEVDGNTVTIEARKIKGFGDYELIRKMRGSICILGPLLSRLRKAAVSMPGGCVIGTRPVDLHLKGLRALGAKIEIEEGYVRASTKKLKGTEIFLGGRSGPTVLGTANIMMAATLASGTTIIDSAACEPEIIDLANFLIAMGADIQGAGSPTITIQGVSELHGAEHEVIPDRIETATFMIAAAATDGKVTIKKGRPEHLQAVIDKLREAGVIIERNGPDIEVSRKRKLQPVDITTQPYSGFPTDVQAQMMALMCITPGISVITERIFEARFTHAAELSRLVAIISIEGPSAIIQGTKKMSGAEVMASDLRASAALVIAGLVAKGTTTVNRIYHIDRGYEQIEKKLSKLGAKIKRVRSDS